MLQERHHALLVARERRDVIVAAGTQLARKHVGFGHGEPRALAGKKGDAGGGVADQRHAALRPSIHADLADTVEVEIAGIVHDLENPRAFPADIGKDIRQCRFALLVAGRLRSGEVFVAKDEKK